MVSENGGVDNEVEDALKGYARVGGMIAAENPAGASVERWWGDAGKEQHFAAVFHGTGPVAERADFYLDGEPAVLVKKSDLP